ncbi:MAG: hypothetical protein NXI30_03765 [bacterium]|nr:hypothetical protein [bacterium]
MKLPNANRAEIPPEKLREYLLSASHPVGRFKSRFFRSLGYTPENWESLSEVLLEVARSGDAVEVSSPFGRKFRVAGDIPGTDGKPAAILTIWILTPDTENPRFVTAYPQE